MRSLLFLAALASCCAIPRFGLAQSQPGPSDADPSERIGPSFELPDPNNVAPLNSRPVPQPPAPHYLNRPVPITSPPTLAPTVETIAPPAVDEPTYVVPLSQSPAPQDLPPEISPNAEKWRYKFCDGLWWYYQPSGRWSYWSAGRWVEHSASRYSNMPANLHPPTQRRWALGRKLGPQPSNSGPPPALYGPSNNVYGPDRGAAYPPSYYASPTGSASGGAGIY